ncbi:MAG: poly-gamma-glutamate biosynthesis protein PgsC/CapC [Longimicrobiales bacterium]|nr:poly-gamma-glutamate biosynthesis protein PgsC/CapC [Longimicrobiales bacterium]
MGIELPFLGVLLSLAFVWLTGVFPGGIIVPSYLVLFLREPERIAGTLLAAFLSMGAYRLASRWLILFGRRRWAFLVLAGGLWATAGGGLLPFIFPASVEYRVIGWVIPGLIAHHMERQGAVVTTAALVTATVALGFLGRLLGLA